MAKTFRQNLTDLFASLLKTEGNETKNQRPPYELISSTSAYLRNFAKKLATSTDIDRSLGELRFTMDAAIITPSNCMSDAAELLAEYKKYYFPELSQDLALKMTTVYIESVNKAKQEGRYFGRNKEEVKQRFHGDTARAQRELIKFYNRHGFQVMSEDEFNRKRIDGRTLGEFVMEFYDPTEAFKVKPVFQNFELQINRGYRPLPRS